MIRVWAVLSKYFPNFSGTAIQGHRIMRELSDRDFYFEVLTGANHKAASMAGQRIVKDGLSIRYLSIIRQYQWRQLISTPFLRKLIRYINSILSNLTLNLKIMWVLWREGRQGDIVHFHSFNETTFLASGFARMLKMHSVVLLTLLGSDDPHSISKNGAPILKRFRLKTFASMGAIITLCSAQTESCRLMDIPMEKVVQIPCAVDTKRFHPLTDAFEKKQLKSELGLKPDGRYIVFAGSATLRKGIDVLVRAFIDVARTIDDVNLLIVGPSDFSDHARYSPALQDAAIQIKKEIELNGLDERVYWTGRVDNVHQYFQAADIFCFPTRREGFGIVIAEAMATGLPCVVSRLPGVTTDHISSEKEGILIPGHDPSDYAKALTRLLEHPTQAQQMGEGGRTRAVSAFSMKVVTQQFAQVYEEIAREAPERTELSKLSRADCSHREAT